MAIWDEAINKQNENTTLVADARHCPSCASKLNFDIRTGKMNCNFCGVSYYPEFFEFQKDIGEIELESEEVNMVFERQEIVCNSCGGSIVTDNNTTATFCPFCGNNALVTNRLKDKYQPQFIIPFKVTRESAEGILNAWLATKKNIPGKFRSKATIEKMTPLYVPFWLVDANCTISVEGKGNYITASKVKCNYDVSRKAKVNFEFIPFDGSSHILDKLMESIEPYDYSGLTRYSEEYLYGFFAEKYNQSVKDMSQRVSDRIREYMDEVRIQKMDVDQYEEFYIEKDLSNVDSHKSYYALLPVWFLKISYNGLTYEIAINGQTGKIFGNTPVNHAAVKVKQGFLSFLSCFIVMASFVAVIALLYIVLLFLFHVDIRSAWAGEVFVMALALSQVFGIPIMILLAHRRKGFAPVNFVNKYITKIDRTNKNLDAVTFEMPSAATYTDISRIKFEKEDVQSTAEALDPMFLI